MTQLIAQGGQKNQAFGDWLFTNSYRTGDPVIRAGVIYTANDTIPANTAFVEGSTGATWSVAVTGGGGGSTTTGVITGTAAQDYQTGTTEPTARSVAGGSSPLQTGDLWFNDTELQVWNGGTSSWVDSSRPAIMENGTSNVTVALDSDITFVVDGTTEMTLSANGAALTGYTESVTALLGITATFAPDISTSTIQRFSVDTNFTFNGFTNPIAGQSGTFIITQDTNGSRLMSSTMLFAGGMKTLSTAPGATDIISVFYDGVNYYASLTTGYA